MSDKTIIGADSSFQQESSLSSARVKAKKTKMQTDLFSQMQEYLSREVLMLKVFSHLALILLVVIVKSFVLNVALKGVARRAVKKCRHLT